MEEFLFNAFITLFVVMDPVGLAPVYGGLTVKATAVLKRQMAVRGIVVAGVILYAFALGGSTLLDALGVSLPAFRIAGGVLLFLLAIDMILVRAGGMHSTTTEEKEEARKQEDISVFPLAIPLIAGPGAMTSLVLLMGKAEGNYQYIGGLMGVVAGVLLLCLLALLASRHLMRILGVTGSNVVSRVLGIVLAALAVQFILDGLKGAGFML